MNSVFIYSRSQNVRIGIGSQWEIPQELWIKQTANSSLFAYLVYCWRHTWTTAGLVQSLSRLVNIKLVHREPRFSIWTFICRIYHMDMSLYPSAFVGTFYSHLSFQFEMGLVLRFHQHALLQMAIYWVLGWMLEKPPNLNWIFTLELYATHWLLFVLINWRRWWVLDKKWSSCDILANHKNMNKFHMPCANILRETDGQLMWGITIES